jgi:restriction system protein
MNTRVGQLEVSRGVRGGATYRLELWHDGLKKHRVIKSSEPGIVGRKAEMQASEWDERWSQVSARDHDRRTREGQKSQQEENKRLAAERSAEAQHELGRLGSILRQTLEINDAIDWQDLKATDAFPEPRPVKPRRPAKPKLQDKPPEPKPDEPTYQPKFGILDKLFTSRRERLIADSRSRYQDDHRAWRSLTEAVVEGNAAAETKYREDLSSLEQEYRSDVAMWEGRQAAYLEQQRLSNEAVEAQRAAYTVGTPEAITEYCDLVLSRSDYPDYFPQEYNLDYNIDNKLLVVEYALPAPEDLPTLKEVKYVSGRDEFLDQHLTQSQISKLYDELLYQIVLRTVHELFEADVIGAIGTIVLNGVVTSIDRSSGKQVTACVLSLRANRDEFMAVNLANVDPKACFKALKGVGSSKLHSLAAVAPIMQLRRDDGRFVSAYEVAHTLDDSSNLAAMDWEDFEHLIREVFAEEFSSAGGEVKVTQASRDGGVDAIAFDPDPIRGGKIVIQAKRYSNTVGVAAVRDLYGTLMNEGANKGILVTTSDYGPDAYAFANGKPLVLLNGANLLHMLEKHGHRARIDLAEARRLAMAQRASR